MSSQHTQDAMNLITKLIFAEIHERKEKDPEGLYGISPRLPGGQEYT